MIKVDIDVQDEDANAVKEKLKELCGDNQYCRATPDELKQLLMQEYGNISKKELHTRLGRIGVKSKIGRIDGKMARFYEIYKDRI